ncbi:MAG: type II 3-dehydroquinate dehydratase [Ruminococcaceae bacterium]|nr:type II 3-dehydroquinate dehydratase [Oscillospiraceae bacterium]
MKIMVINGVNLNFVGIREKNIYGDKSFESLCNGIKEYAEQKGVEVTLFQSNCEGEIVDALQRAYFEGYDGVIINPGAYTHYSYAIYDAIKSISIPCIEVHMSNVHSREDFRKIGVTTAACKGQISGFGENSYKLAIDALTEYVK